MDCAFKIGIAEIDCTPQPGVPLMGHFRDNYAATGTHDPLRARAIVFMDAQGGQVALVTIDVCMLGREQVRLLRAMVHSACGIPQDHILVASTHTHGSIATKSLYITPCAADSDIERFLRGAADAVVQANRSLQPGLLSTGSATENRISFNRRLRDKERTTHMNWEDIDPSNIIDVLGPIDPEIKTLTARWADRPQASMVNFALHPAILDYENSLFTADYVGYLAEAMKIIHGNAFISLFFNGCCGDINHLNYADIHAPRRGYVMAQRIGYLLAAKVTQAIRESVPLGGDVVRVSREYVPLERFRVSEELYEKSRSFLKANSGNDYQPTDGLDLKYGAKVWMQMFEQQNQPDQVEVMAIRIGSAAIVGVPGEVFCELGLAIKQQSPAAFTMVVELANDAVGYFPTQKAFAEGGYEITPGATNYEPGSGEKLVASAVRQLHKLFKKGGE